MTDLQLFNFGEFSIGLIFDKNGEPWFVAKDIAEILGYTDAFQLTKKLDDDEVQIRQIAGAGNRGVSFINDTGLCSIVFSSQKPSAKSLKKWVTSEVLPSIRKTGEYSNARNMALEMRIEALERKRPLCEIQDKTTNYEAMKKRIIHVLTKKGALTEGVLIQRVNRRKRRDILNVINDMISNGELCGTHELKKIPTVRYFLL